MSSGVRASDEQENPRASILPLPTSRAMERVELSGWETRTINAKNRSMGMDNILLAMPTRSILPSPT